MVGKFWFMLYAEWMSFSQITSSNSMSLTNWKYWLSLTIIWNQSDAAGDLFPVLPEQVTYSTQWWCQKGREAFSLGVWVCVCVWGEVGSPSKMPFFLQYHSWARFCLFVFWGMSSFPLWPYHCWYITTELKSLRFLCISHIKINWLLFYKIFEDTITSWSL